MSGQFKDDDADIQFSQDDDNEIGAEDPIEEEDDNESSFLQFTISRSKSSVWDHFDTNTEDYPGQPVCKSCKINFSSSSSTSTLRRHLNKHKIVTPKLRQRTIHEFRNDPYPEHEQQERDKYVINWIICDTQLFSVVECNEWRQMISKFDPRYRFHSRHTTKDQIMSLFQEKKEQVMLVVNQVPGKISFTTDM